MTNDTVNFVEKMIMEFELEYEWTIDRATVSVISEIGIIKWVAKMQTRRGHPMIVVGRGEDFSVYDENEFARLVNWYQKMRENQ